MPDIPLGYFFTVSAVLFGLGLYGALRRSNTLTILMCVELMLNAVNINFIAFSRYLGTTDPVRGQAFVVFIITLAAAEVAVGLAILISLVRRRRGIDVNEIDMLKG